MRPLFPSLGAPLLLLACSSVEQTPSALEASVATPAEDGSTAACTSVGGVCAPYTTSCPLPQQNATLCGATVLICCLPSTSAPPQASPESGVETGSADSGAEAGPVDAASYAPTGG